MNWNDGKTRKNIWIFFLTNVEQKFSARFFSDSIQWFSWKNFCFLETPVFPIQIIHLLVLLNKDITMEIAVMKYLWMVCLIIKISILKSKITIFEVLKLFYPSLLIQTYSSISLTIYYPPRMALTLFVTDTLHLHSIIQCGCQLLRKIIHFWWAPFSREQIKNFPRFEYK